MLSVVRWIRAIFKDRNHLDTDRQSAAGFHLAVNQDKQTATSKRLLEALSKQAGKLSIRSDFFLQSFKNNPCAVQRA